MKATQEDKKNPGSTKCRLVDSFWSFWPAFQRWAEAQASDTGLSPQRTRILAILQEKGPQMMSELRDQLGVTATNITARGDALEKDGLAVRKAHPTDRRATLIEIGAQAPRGLGQDCCAYRERVGELFSKLTESDRKELLRILDSLRERIDGAST